MGPKPSRARETMNKTQNDNASLSSPSTTVPRRTSSRIAEKASSIYDNEKEGDDHEKSGAAGSQGHASQFVEVAIPVKKVESCSNGSSPSSVEDPVRNGTNESNTPATSIGYTPVDSDTQSNKRVDGSVRAQELRSSTFSLGSTKKGVKRNSSAVSTDEAQAENTDAALARALQLEEYQSPVKRQKPDEYNRDIEEIQESADDDDALSDFDGHSQVSEDSYRQRQPRRKVKISLGDMEEGIIPNSDESFDGFTDGSDGISLPGMDWPSLFSDSDNEMPIYRQQRGRNRRTGFPAAYCYLYEGMSNRAARERAKLENQQPIVRTMWEDLEKSPPIVPVAAEQPAGITLKLKPFQLEGLNWMMQQEKSPYAGGLLGDEMGMGKTIQTVSLLMSDYPAGKPSLVVVPPVALMQWQSEIAEYTNGLLKVLVYHNSNPKVKRLSKKDIEKYDVIIISYSGLESIHRRQSKGLSRDGELVKQNSVIHSIHYHRLILDEAHSIKQRTTSVARSCFALNSNYKWCLSGTPVQNRIGEFFSLLRFLEVRPFACYFCKSCKCQSLHWSQTANKKCTNCNHSGFHHVSIFNQEILNPLTERSNPMARQYGFSRLRLLTDRIMLRRVKRDYTSSMELPPKRVVLHDEFFGEIERDFSKSIMTNSTRQFDTYVSSGVMLNNYANIFGLIMQMRQVANHPDLILKKHGESGQNSLVCCVCDDPAEEAIRSRCRHEFCRQCAKDYINSFEDGSTADCPRCHIPLSIDFEQPDIEQEEEYVKKNSIVNRIKMDDWTSSTKIEMLVYDLYKLRNKKQTHKSIVFSQFTSMLQLVEWRLRRAGFETVMLDGSMTPAQRQKSVDYFMNNVNVEVFLVSLKAGGVALNLTEASRVFIVDPWWNPAVEWQSADRCHRIGQRRPCVITRLCIEDSVESRIVLLQEKKANLINATINKDEGAAMEKLTPEDMEFLFRGG